MTAPRRRGTRSLAPALICALATLACGGDDDSVAPAVRTPETGAYLYEAVIQTGDSTADTLSGSITITVAAEDSLVGSWSVAGYSAEPLRAPWNVNAYALPAIPVGPGGPGRSVNHRVWRLDASSMECQVAYRHITQQTDTFISGVAENDCSLERSGS